MELYQFDVVVIVYESTVSIKWTIKKNKSHDFLLIF